MTQDTDIALWQEGLGDMSLADFREHGHHIVEWIADYLANQERYPVLSQVTPGEIAAALPNAAPAIPEGMDVILRDFEEILLPGITHGNHPGFYAYFAMMSSAPGILAEFLAAAVNANAMLWRTSPAATELESVTLNWLRQLLGLPSPFEGVIYSGASISTLVAIAAAREATGLDFRRQGMMGRPDAPPLRMYCSEEAHSSVEKGAITLGVGQDGVRKIPTDTEYRMDVDALRGAIDEDIQNGKRPFCVVATAGTTSSTSIDPVTTIADVCEHYGLWLHVDAAYGGVAAIVPEMRWVLAGAERADSLVVNPHKWLFTPLECSAFFTRRLDVVRTAFSLVPAYLETGEDPIVRNYMDYGPQLGRSFRALKLWFTLRSFGAEGVQTRIREHIRLGKLFAGWIETAPNWEVLAPVHFSTVCFRAVPPGMNDQEIDRLNQAVMDRTNATGEVFLSPTRLQGRFSLRIAVGSLRTQERHIARLWNLLNEALAFELGEPAGVQEPDITSS